MAGGKRASMREGPLAALFRRTDEESPEEQRDDQRQPQGRRTASPRARATRAAARLRAAVDRAGPEQPSRVPSPKERLSAAFSHDIPHDVLERPGEPQREYRPRDEPRISRDAGAPAGAACRRRRRRAA